LQNSGVGERFAEGAGPAVCGIRVRVSARIQPAPAARIRIAIRFRKLFHRRNAVFRINMRQFAAKRRCVCAVHSSQDFSRAVPGGFKRGACGVCEIGVEM